MDELPLSPPSPIPAGVREHPAHPFDGTDVHRTSVTSPSHLPEGEGGEPSALARDLVHSGANRSAQGARHFDRVRWRCRRGLLELDVMLQDFLVQRYASLTPPEQQAFDLLLETPDVTLLAYLQGDQYPPDKELVEIVAKIRQ